MVPAHEQECVSPMPSRLTGKAHGSTLTGPKQQLPVSIYTHIFLNSLMPKTCHRLSCQGRPQGCWSNESPRMMVGGDEWSQLWSLPAWVGSLTRDHELSGPGPIFWALVYLSAKWEWSYYQSQVTVIRFKCGNTCRGPRALEAP